ncbi:ABC transporter substrate-binding protein [Yinghuangia seranimata]|uniref:ABC transporter substrate-binding protein n=1 Tax=Yinghuangia seranimata TaxID=408067 RepID=UPI00248C9730|nr:ABC transporter substrate-binding protein [Yinghuangia seranimata]MDI2126579.1 ABC transporter substrate-binding protein [Yinghuangia seranimata]
MRRSIPRLATALVLTGLATAACGTGGSSDDPANPSAGVPGQTSAASAAPDSALNPNATVNVRLVLEPTSLNLTTTAGAALEQLLLDNVYQGLLTVDTNADNKIVPALAASYETSADGLTYTFHLAKGAAFHDGSPLTADDVVWSLRQATAPGSKQPNAKTLGSIANAAAPDPGTVVLTLKQRDNDLTWALTQRAAVVYKKGTDFTKLDAAENGSGPFKLETWQRGSAITLVRNDAYQGPGPKARSAKVVLRYITDRNAADNAESTGQTDVQTSADATLLQPFTGNAGFTVLRGTTTDKYTLAFNNAKAPLNNPAVRHALRRAVDKAALIQALGGAGVRVGGPVPTSDPWYQDLTSVDGYDPAAAKQALAAAGYPDGLKLTLKIPSIYPAAIGDVLVSDFKKAGIELTVRQQEFTAWLTEVYTNKDYDLSLVNHAEARDLGNYANPGYYFGYDNKQVQDWFAQATVAPDEKTRVDLLGKVGRQASEDAAADWLFQAQTLTVVRKGVSGAPQHYTSSRLPLAGVGIVK